MQTPNHTIEYRHNALGNRVAKVKDGVVVERYLWQDKTTLLAVYDGDGNLKQRFEYTLGHAPTSFTEDGEAYYLLIDHLGSPRVVTDSAGQVVKAIEYDAYGNVISDSNPAITLPFGFAGGLKDVDTGLVRFGYRDYDPRTGRWSARDPIGFAGGDTNLYGYVSNDPLGFIDPTGEFANWAIGFAAGAVGDVVIQLAFNGGDISKVNWTTVAIAGTMGAVNPFSIGSSMYKFSKANRQLDRARNVARRERARRRVEQRSDKNRRDAYEEILAFGAMEGSAELIGSMLPKDYIGEYVGGYFESQEGVSCR